LTPGPAFQAGGMLGRFRGSGPVETAETSFDTDGRNPAITTLKPYETWDIVGAGFLPSRISFKIIPYHSNIIHSWLHIGSTTHPPTIPVTTRIVEHFEKEIPTSFATVRVGVIHKFWIEITNSS